MLAVDVAVFWEQDRLEVCHLASKGASYVIGEGAGCHHVAPGVERHTLVRVGDDAVMVHPVHGGDVIALELGQHTVVEAGPLTFRVEVVRAGAVSLPRVPGAKRDGLGPHLLVAGVVHLMAAAVLMSMPRDVSSLNFDDGQASALAAMRFMNLPETQESTLAPIDLTDLPETPEATGADVAERAPAEHASATRSRLPSLPMAAADVTARRRAVAADAAARLRTALDASLGSGGPLESVLGSRSGDAWSRLERGTGGDSPFAGMGLPGGGPPGGQRGAGGLGDGYDVGPMATLGGDDDRIRGTTGRLPSLGQRTPKAPPPTVHAGKPDVSDGLDLEVVRRVIRQHVAEYRACYERRLNLNHGLEGKVTMKFVIGGNGDVIVAQVDEDTSGDAELGACLTERVRRWGFPPPAGGGRVVVRYPFVFRASGG
jgi:TonB family protein